MGRNNKGGAKPPSKRGNAKPDGNAAADAKVAKEVEELRNKSIKSFKKGSTAKATRSTPSSNVDPPKVSDARTLFLSSSGVQGHGQRHQTAPSGPPQLHGPGGAVSRAGAGMLLRAESGGGSAHMCFFLRAALWPLS